MQTRLGMAGGGKGSNFDLISTHPASSRRVKVSDLSTAEFDLTDLRNNVRHSKNHCLRHIAFWKAVPNVLNWAMHEQVLQEQFGIQVDLCD